MSPPRLACCLEFDSCFNAELWLGSPVAGVQGYESDLRFPNLYLSGVSTITELWAEERDKDHYTFVIFLWYDSQSQ